MVTEDTPTSWVNLLEAEDLSFIKRFVLASGSLKALAEAYAISYPTVRLRLDRVIAKLELFDKQSTAGNFEKILRAQYIDGKIDLDTLKKLLAAHRKELETGGKK